MKKDTWKGIGVVVVLTSLLAAAVIPLVMAQEEIECTVTTGVYSVSLDDYDVAYGSMLASDEKASGTITATNNGGIPEDLYIYGEEATGPYQPSPSPGFTPTWTLGTSPGEDIYQHTFNVTAETSLTTSNQMLADNILAFNTQGFTLKLYTPTIINTLGDYSFSVYVVATAP